MTFKKYSRENRTSSCKNPLPHAKLPSAQNNKKTMHIEPIYFIYSLIAAAIGASASFFIIKKKKDHASETAEKAREKIENAKKEAQTILEEAEEKKEQIKEQGEIANEKRKKQLEKTEMLLQQKQETLDRRDRRNLEIKQAVQTEEKFIEELKEQTRGIEEAIGEKLIKKTGLTKEETKEKLVEEAKKEILLEKDNYLQKVENNAQETAVKEAKNLIIETIHKFSSPTSVEKKGCNIQVKNDNKKGFLIGKEGKNIEFFEKMLDVDVIFNNDSHDTVTISAFDLVKRNIAKIALQNMLKERVITEDKIKKYTKQAEKETEKDIIETGEKIVKLLNINNKHPKLVKTIGRLKFRTSYGQNILKHSLEVCAFSTIMASELGADIEIARHAGFFHDIGKAIDQELDEAHDILTKELLTKFGFSEEIVHAAWVHHEAKPCKTIEAKVVKAADAISAGRPGARQESIERYLERIHTLEETGSSFEGVRKAFAISAGRELRINVDEEKITDEGVKKLAYDIAKNVEEKLTYPGKIKINVIRRTRVVDYAK